MDAENFNKRLAHLSPAKRALLELKLQQGRAAMATSMTIPRRVTRDSAPLSFAQERLWFLNQLEPESPAYNESSATRLTGYLDMGALERTLNQIIARHKGLFRTD